MYDQDTNQSNSLGSDSDSNEGGESGQVEPHHAYEVSEKRNPFSILPKVIVTAVVLFVFTLVMSILLWISNIELFEGEVYGVLQGINGYGQAAALILGGMLTLYALRRFEKVAVVTVLVIVGVSLPGLLLSPTNKKSQPVALPDVSSSPEFRAADLIKERKKIIRDDLNSYGEVYYPGNINEFDVVAAEWESPKTIGSASSVANLTLTLKGQRDETQISIVYSDSRTDPSSETVAKEFTTYNGVDIVRGRPSTESTGFTSYLMTSADNNALKATIFYDESSLSHTEAENLAYKLKPLSTKFIMLTQQVCVQINGSEWCDSTEF